MRLAITRPISPKMGQCELTYLPRTEIDLDLAYKQHHAYEQTLVRLGCQLVTLPPEPDLPDSVFVEDTAIVLDEVAIITRPGATSRRPETVSVAPILGEYRQLLWLQAPSTLDGGDVLSIGQALYVGVSSRSNSVGIEQLTTLLRPHGYRVVPVPLQGCLHLKSAVTQVAPDTLLLNRHWVEPSVFPGLRSIVVDEQEPMGANALMIGDWLVYSASFPRTRERLIRQGIQVTAVEMSETEKAEGAVTCSSLVFETSAPVSVSAGSN